MTTAATPQGSFYVSQVVYTLTLHFSTTKYPVYLNSQFAAW